jgi:hypothetical protein
VEEQINMHLSQLQTWKRVFFMLLFAVVLTLIRWLAWVVILLQLFCVLITGRRNSNILSFGRSISIYDFHIMLFLTFCTDVLPFPFSAWHTVLELTAHKVTD